MLWHFHYPTRIAFYPPDFEERGLGGTEASIVVLTRALARRGHNVEVYNSCYKPGIYDGVRWKLASEISKACVPDVAVSVRFKEAIWPQGIEAAQRIFWMMDDRVGGANEFRRVGGAAWGTIVAASQAMIGKLAEIGLSAQVITHPIEVDRYRDRVKPRRACLFSSMPNRGLDVALRIWPEITARVPDAELWVTSGWKLWGYMAAEEEDRWRHIIGSDPLPKGVRLYGAVPRSRLVELQKSAWLTLYPCRFPEMFCISAAEAVAAGCPLIASAKDALVERIEHGRTGILIEGDIEAEDVQKRFVHEAASLLVDEDRREEYALRAMAGAQTMKPDVVAEAWERLVAR